jgi:bacterioferritin-associated ferredoxin
MRSFPAGIIFHENDIEFHFLRRTLASLGDPSPARLDSVLVCHCKAIYDRTIRQVVESGARTCRQVDRACAAGGSCGGCQPLIRAIIADERQKTRAASGEVGVAAS